MLQLMPASDSSSTAENCGSNRSQTSGIFVNYGKEEVFGTVEKSSETNETSSFSKK